MGARAARKTEASRERSRAVAADSRLDVAAGRVVGPHEDQPIANGDRLRKIERPRQIDERHRLDRAKLARDHLRQRFL